MFSYPSKHGWIGIDAGASCVKIAQASRHAGGLRLDRAAIVPRSIAWDKGAGGDLACSQHEIESALAITGGVVGRRAAAVLSMGASDLSPGREHQPVAQSAGHAYSSASWHADSSAGDDGWYTFATAESTADRLCRDISTAGLSCRSIDATPHALARAVAWGSPELRGRTVAALDWGYSGALLCAVRDGHPVYVRQLKDCALRQVEEQIGQELGLSRGEAIQVAAGASSGDSGAARELLAELSAPLASRLGEELKRTLNHLRSHRRSLAPEGIQLFGGGATLGFESRLADKADVPTQAWTLAHRGPNEVGPLCLFGPAIALSALAWEES